MRSQARDPDSLPSSPSFSLTGPLPRLQAIQGLIVMSPQLEGVYQAAYDGKLPDLWRAKSYPSRKPIGAYIADLLERLQFLQKWYPPRPLPSR